MTPIEKLESHPLEWQRHLKFGGYYEGKLDGINGPLTEDAAARWFEAHDKLVDKFGSVDKRSESYLLTLQPLAAMPVRQMLVILRTMADWKVICGHRTYAEQDKLYKKRPRVTRARGGQSYHNFGLAADVCLFVGGKDVWEPDDGPDSIYKPVAAVAKKLGLVWGGNFASIYDPGHVQLTEIPVSRLHAAYTTGSYNLHHMLT